MKNSTKTKRKQKKTNKSGIVLFFLLFIFFTIIAIILPSIQTKKLSYGASIPFTPVPAKPNLQLEWFLVPTGSQSQPGTTSGPTNPPQKQPVPPTLPPSTPKPAPTNPGPDQATCSGYVNSGVPLPASCDCPDVYIICPYTTSDPTDVTVGPNGCEDPLFVGSPPKTGKFCIDKPVIYLYPTKPMFVDVKIHTTGSVVVSDPLYPQDGWENVLANPNGSLQYQGKDYSELFYETSVTDFQKPAVGITLPTADLSDQLNGILDHLGLIGQEKEEFLSYWTPRLKALHSPYIYFSLLSASSKANIDAVAISPKPDTMIDFIAYFKPVAFANNDVLQLPPTPARKGFVAVEWGGVIDK
jgi:hypothetical protein